MEERDWRDWNRRTSQEEVREPLARRKDGEVAWHLGNKKESLEEEVF